MSSETTDQTVEETKTGVSVTVKAHYLDLSEARSNIEDLNNILAHQLGEARRNDPGNDRED